MTISDDDAAELRRLQAEAAEERRRMSTPPAQLAYYRKLREVRQKGATHDELADALGVSRGRPSQLLARADEVLGPDA